MDTRHEILAHILCSQAKRWIIAPNGKTAVVRLSEPVDDIAALAHNDILIDGCSFKCCGVAAAPHSPPFQTGEYLMLLVESPE